MFWYFMKLRILTAIVPIFITFLGIAIIAASQSSGGLIGALLVVVDLIYLALSLYGSYRLIKSHVYSLHLAVKRDGICFVQDDHIDGLAIVAALHIFDACIFVSKQSQTVSQACMSTFYFLPYNGFLTSSS